jgi:hypothetical protein
MTNTNVFDPIAYPDLVHIHDRHPLRPEIERVYVGEGSVSQGADINEMLSIEETKRKAIGDLVAKDGDRMSGADITVDADAGTVGITAGVLYIQGGSRSIPARVLTGVPMTGDIKIGARMVPTPVTAEDDSLYLGLDPTTPESYGEAGGVRLVLVFSWGYESDGGAGQFFPYVTLRNGEIIEQDSPPTLSGIQQQIALYDYEALENYIARGCQVSALGLSAGKQTFSIGEGSANILGFKIRRPTSTRFSETENPDLGTVDQEPHTFDDGGTGSVVIAIRRPPVAAVNTAVVTKQRTVTVTKGVTDGIDPLPDDSVTAIMSVVQGATTYVAGTDYAQSGDNVDWLSGGAEPTTGSSYQCTYRYLDAVTPDQVTSTTIKVSGGVTGQPVFLGYSYKIPRYDRICIDQFGNIVYLEGISAAVQPQPPQVPATLLKLATIKNDWFGSAPVVENDGDKAVPVSLQRKMLNKLIDLLNLVTLQRQTVDINIRSAGNATSTFSDPLTSDFYRDAGEVQNGAVFGGNFQIPIVPTFHQIDAGGPLFLNFSQESVIIQNLISSCELINPYQVFSPLPALLSIVPRVDYWTQQQTVWLSDQTRVFGSGNQERVTDVDVISDTRTEPLRFLRQIPIAFTISQFGPGEILTKLTFDSVDVTPVGLVAGINGVLTGTFNIPANITSGAKEVVATGGSGAKCSAVFTGQGRLETIELQRVTTVERFQRATVRSRINGGSADLSGGGWGSVDPQAQSFSLTEGRHISSVDIRFCAIGNRAEPVILEVVTMDNGFPTTDVVAQCVLDMGPVVANNWTRFAFDIPFYLPRDTLFAFVVKTNDPVHGISAADRGKFDALHQSWIAGQPYTIGTRFSSSNAQSWTVHQDSDLTFQLNCAVFNPTQRVVDLGILLLTNCSDLIIRADTFIPTDDASVVFMVTFGSEAPIMMLPDQVLERSDFFSGNVAIKAILTGSAKISPTVQQNILVIAGTMQGTGEYISRAWPLGTAIEVDAMMSTKLPVGSSIVVSIDKANDVWTTLPQTAATAIDDGYTERTYHIDPYTAVEGRLRVVLTGTPAARPTVADMRAWTF